ncbi:hypothetical protein [Leptospira interrogans]|uniref:hypothetical protein n=1 Tax=Leptospira interrogans TaxID=173 RepID=UPI00029743D5|nr:hypothetical protein [Leptospira interrogans]EKR80734.1 hypothetical protein LEP1GSC099_2056 [Leptospira interrogans str. UI 08452]EMN37628.1 hypothetical protein LEP1GSC084_3541 [Leptospira interrogans serovar Medanensis str. L0448]EMN37905.1 hypothetical protein LEP1GSC085_2653 [Leptospira interrogans str. L0996]EMN94462.1 hypothetical protein LEP1GSC110_1598 [Leptospira interrogans serovar Medanensis str. UT053]EMN98369.1 hypothetical protein LEP1GSC112_3357 [Leptospira interrogans serov
MKLSLNTQKKCAEDFVTRTRLLVLIGKFLIDLRIKKNHLKNSSIFLSARKNRSKEFKLRESKKLNPYIFSIICIFLISKAVASESYSGYRLDDLLLLKDGKRDLTGKGRYDEIEPDKDENLTKTREEINTNEAGKNEFKEKESVGYKKQTTGFYGNGALIYRGLRQKGGVWGEKSDRSFSRGIFSPEVGWKYKGEQIYNKILISPYLQYEENVSGNKTITKGADGELLWIAGMESPNLRIGTEMGRGYQRLDRNGFMFVGFLNYGEFQIHLKKYGVSASMMGAQMQNTALYTERDRSESPQRISGGSIQILEKSWIQNFRIFYYLYKESRQDAVRGDLYRKEEPYRPYGAYQYYGFELSSSKFWGFRIDLDAIKVIGSREYGLDPFQSNDTTQTTKGSFIGSKIVWERPEAEYFLGGFYTSKDEELKIDRKSNGYSGIRTDPRGYGGKTSFLLMESLLIQEGNIFQEDGVVTRPNFENKGIKLLELGIKKNWDHKWTAQGMIVTTSSAIGRGWEGVLTGGYQSEHSYILMSLSYAYVDPQKEKKLFFEEWKVDEPKREYSRIYLSAGVHF